MVDWEQTFIGLVPWLGGSVATLVIAGFKLRYDIGKNTDRIEILTQRLNERQIIVDTTFAKLEGLIVSNHGKTESLLSNAMREIAELNLELNTRVHETTSNVSDAILNITKTYMTSQDIYRLIDGNQGSTTKSFDKIEAQLKELNNKIDILQRTKT